MIQLQLVLLLLREITFTPKASGTASETQTTKCNAETGTCVLNSKATPGA